MLAEGGARTGIALITSAHSLRFTQD